MRSRQPSGAEASAARALAGLGAALALFGVLWSGPALAEEGDPGASPVDLDALLKLPDRTPSTAADPRRGGYTRTESVPTM